MFRLLPLSPFFKLARLKSHDALRNISVCRTKSYKRLLSQTTDISEVTTLFSHLNTITSLLCFPVFVILLLSILVVYKQAQKVWYCLL